MLLALPTCASSHRKTTVKLLRKKLIYIAIAEALAFSLTSAGGMPAFKSCIATFPIARSCIAVPNKSLKCALHALHKSCRFFSSWDSHHSHVSGTGFHASELLLQVRCPSSWHSPAHPLAPPLLDPQHRPLLSPPHPFQTSPPRSPKVPHSSPIKVRVRLIGIPIGKVWVIKARA